MLFINPLMAELKNVVPSERASGTSGRGAGLLAEIVYYHFGFSLQGPRCGDGASLPEIIKRSQAEQLPDHIAHHEWENRFKIMVIKRLGPSLVPAEVVVPLSNLGKVMAEIEQKVNQPMVKEGIMVRKGRSGQPEVVILGLIPSDQRKFRYNFVFALSLTIMKIAEKYGGRPYSTGLYYASKAEQVLGKERVDRIKAFKKESRPQRYTESG